MRALPMTSDLPTVPAIELVYVRALLTTCLVSLYICFLPILQPSCAADIFHHMRYHALVPQ